MGCQTFVSEDEKEMFSKISEYFKDPASAEERYVEKSSSLKELEEAFEDLKDYTNGSPRVGGMQSDKTTGHNLPMPVIEPHNR